MTLGQRIQELRKGLDLSQEELGEKMGISRQAISKWEADQTIPDLDKLIALSRLFGLTIGQLLGVEQPLPPPAAPKSSRRLRLLLAGMGTLVLALTVAVAVLGVQVWNMKRQSSIDDLLYIYLSGQDLFQRAECTYSNIAMDFLPTKGTEDLTLDFTLEPVKQLKDWTVIGLTAEITGENPPWWLDPKGQPTDSTTWQRTEELPVSRGHASLTLPSYGGESVSIRVTLQKKGGGQIIEFLDPVFTMSPETDASGAVTGLLVTENAAPAAAIPRFLFSLLPDLQFEP